MDQIAPVVKSIVYLIAILFFIVAAADFRTGNKQDSQIEMLVAIFFLLVGKL